MEASHNKILKRIIGVRSEVDDTAESFCRRRNRRVAAEREQLNLSVSREWALSLVRWVEHLRRHPDMPAAMLINVQTELWLQTMRALRWTVSIDPNLRFGATGTRSGPGRPFRWGHQWLENLEEVSGTENQCRCKALTRERAMLLQAFLEHGRIHGEERA